MNKKGGLQMNLKKNQGITLVALAITIIILLIIAGIATYSGVEIIKSANLEALKTNMLLIEAKAREYVEEVNFKMGPKPDETKRSEVRKSVYEDEAGLKKHQNLDYLLLHKFQLVMLHAIMYLKIQWQNGELKIFS